MGHRVHNGSAASWRPSIKHHCQMNVVKSLLRARRITIALAVASAPALGQQTQPTGEAWRIVQPPQSSLVYARDGSLIGEVGRQWRTSVAIKSLPKYLPQAFVSVEDQRFYQHDGVDVIGVLGAVKDNIMGERRGASTITQQLVGNMHPDLIDRRDISIGRKLREQSAAREMEKHYTKDQILEAYLNQVDLGHNWFGVEAASRHYFGKSAARLSLAEAASLASLPKSPPLYDPVRYPERNKTRRNLILTLMADQGYITKAQAEAAKRESIVTVTNGGMSAASNYFIDAVRREAERAGIQVMNGGFKIHTTLDPALQRAAVSALLEGTAKVEARPGYRHVTMAKSPRGETDYLQGAVVALDPSTGDVRALVGGRNWVTAPFNRATNALRQPGSAIKPIVYAQAIHDSIAPSEIVPDTALAIPMSNTVVYRPENSDGRFLGPITIREALVQSRNPVAVQLGMRVGIDSVGALAQRMGIDAPMSPYPSSAIGASVVRPIDLVAAYAAFATDGKVAEPRFVTRIEDLSGRVAYAQPASEPRQVLDPRVAFIVRNMMIDAAERGTGASARRAVPPAVHVAGKTGTTNDNVDVWFVGMTPDLVAGVWLGFDKPKTIAPGVGGGTLAAPIWGQMVARYYEGRRATEWAPPPEGLTFAELDRLTGQVVTPATPPDRRYVEYFLEGTEPPEVRMNPWRVPIWGPIVMH
jgi:penicillin-binding protein 2D